VSLAEGFLDVGGAVEDDDRAEELLVVRHRAGGDPGQHGGADVGARVVHERAADVRHGPTARSLEVVGERWTRLIICNPFYGLRRYTDIRTRIGVAPAILTQRLNRLVEEDVVARVPGIGARPALPARAAEALNRGQDRAQAPSTTGERSRSGSHQSRCSAYQRTVSRTPSSNPTSGSQPSSRRILVESSR